VSEKLTCTKCHQSLPDYHFYPSNSSTCRACLRAKDKINKRRLAGMSGLGAAFDRAVAAEGGRPRRFNRW